MRDEAEVWGRAPGKLILFGEHAVVHGFPAIAIAVDRWTRVGLTDWDGPTRIQGEETRDPLLKRALSVALPPWGLGVSIRTDLPIGRGMGSSASLSVALVRAISKWNHRNPGDEEVYRRALTLEDIFHGGASGLDVAVIQREGLISFRRGEPPRIEELVLQKGESRFSLPLVVLDSGVSASTAQMVSAVHSRRPGADPLLARLGAIAEQVARQLSDLRALGAAMGEAHSILGELGVSTPALDSLVDLALREGAWGAKLSGAGGGGVVVALVPDERRTGLLKAAEKAGIVAFSLGPVVRGET